MVSRIRFLVLTEDSGKQALPTIQTLLKTSLQNLEASLDTSRLRLEPIGEAAAVAATRANAWKSRKPNPAKNALLLAIANALETESFVVFHVDADTPWSTRSKSQNREAFDLHIRQLVVDVLTTPRLHRGNQPRFTPLSREAAMQRVAKLVLMSPCYSIESWLYQARDAVTSLCRSVHADKKAHGELLASWSDRTKLDEVVKPKELLDCVADKHNQSLAQAFPAREVDEAGRSYSDFVMLLRAAPGLLDALQHQ